MREDMAKVIVERPRRGGGLPFPRGWPPGGPRLPMVDWRRREGIRRPWLRDRPKSLNENLAPLRRFLRARVGRPWDKVYGEVCERINRNSAVQLHVWQHLMQDVCRDPHEVSGDVRRCSWFGFRHSFFVDPKTGLLRENRARGMPRHLTVAPQPVDRIAVDATHEYRLLDGLWFELTLAPLPTCVSVYDMALRKSTPDLSTKELARFYGRHVYAVHKRQLNKREIKRRVTST